MMKGILRTAALVVTLAFPLRGQVLTSQYDNARTGAILTETKLTPANVSAAQFGKIFSYTVDGDVYAQPLYVPGVNIPGKGTHNVLYVATEHDSVYAFDADRAGEALWHVSFLKSGVTTVSAGDALCPFVAPEIGITPTPVIDRASETLYVLARTREASPTGASRYVQRLHALAITTGEEKLGGPVEITASVKGRGAGGSNGEIPFDPLREMPRAGLLLTGGQVYLTWASSCDVKPYHGWVMAYDARTLHQTAVFNTSPDSNESGVWQSDMAPAADANGNVYVVTGNGANDTGSGGRNYGDSVLKLRLNGNNLVVRDSFTPSNEGLLNNRDLDLGSGGPLLLPVQSGRRLLLVAGKEGPLQVLHADQLSEKPAQVLPLGGGMYSTPAYWNGHVFLLASNSSLKDFAVAGGKLSDNPVATGQQAFPNPGGSPVVTSNGTQNGIVWLIETKVWNDYNSTKASVLHAYDAKNIAREIYNSEQNSARDRAGVTVRFTIPTVANGRVYIGTKREVTVYGLLTDRR